MNAPLYHVVSFLRAGVKRYFAEFRADSRPVFVVSKDDAPRFDNETAIAFRDHLRGQRVDAECLLADEPPAEPSAPLQSGDAAP